MRSTYVFHRTRRPSSGRGHADHDVLAAGVRRLYEYNPDVRVVVILRDPVTRAFSNWRHEYFHGRETCPLARRSAAAVPGSLPRHGGRAAPVLCVCRAGISPATNWLSFAGIFPNENIHCEIFEGSFPIGRPVRADREVPLTSIAFPAEMPSIHLNTTHALAYPSTLSGEDIIHLSNLFHHQIRDVEQFLGRRVSSWQARFAAGPGY